MKGRTERYRIFLDRHIELDRTEEWFDGRTVVQASRWDDQIVPSEAMMADIDLGNARACTTHMRPVFDHFVPGK